MRNIYRYIAASIINGMFFLIPVTLVVILFGKIFSLLKKIFIENQLRIGSYSFWYGVVNNLVIIFSILLICFLMGLTSKLKWSKQLIAWIEYNLLSYLPGYHYIKSNAEDLFNVPAHSFSSVLIFRNGENLQLGFKVESITNDQLIVFIPLVPKPMSGAMYIVNKSNVIEIDLSIREAFALLRSMGQGATTQLEKYISSHQIDELFKPTKK